MAGSGSALPCCSTPAPPYPFLLAQGPHQPLHQLLQRHGQRGVLSTRITHRPRRIVHDLIPIHKSPFPPARRPAKSRFCGKPTQTPDRSQVAEVILRTACLRTYGGPGDSPAKSRKRSQNTIAHGSRRPTENQRLKIGLNDQNPTPPKSEWTSEVGLSTARPECSLPCPGLLPILHRTAHLTPYCPSYTVLPILHRPAHLTPCCPSYTVLPTLHRTAHLTSCCPSYTVLPILHRTAHLTSYCPSYTVLPILHRAAHLTPCCPSYTVLSILHLAAHLTPCCPSYTVLPILHHPAHLTPCCPSYILLPILYQLICVISDFIAFSALIMLLSIDCPLLLHCALLINRALIQLIILFYFLCSPS